VSHTSELRDYPRAMSYVAAVERAISAAGHVIVDMADFPASAQAPARVCAERVRGCDVYLGVLGARYGSPVRDRPEVSYTELEFDTAPRRAWTAWYSCWMRTPSSRASRRPRWSTGSSGAARTRSAAGSRTAG
jgi:hypothetical protein